MQANHPLLEWHAGDILGVKADLRKALQRPLKSSTGIDQMWLCGGDEAQSLISLWCITDGDCCWTEYLESCSLRKNRHGKANSKDVPCTWHLQQ